MPNLFIRTKFDSPEEDRLTNALMSVLQHSDREVLSSFLTLAAGREVVVDPEDNVAFDLQVAFEGSRPDARVRAPGLTVIIETKRGGGLDEGQFRRHWANLQKAKEPTILLALTDGYQRPALVDELHQQGTAGVTAGHVGWPQVLDLACRLQDRFEVGTATRLLLVQLEEYLSHLGYCHFRGKIVNDLEEYGAALMAVAKHEKTHKQLLALLKSLESLIKAQPGMMPLTWSTKAFGASDRVDSTRVNFEFLNADVPGIQGARYRILPSFSPQFGLMVNYYMTYARSGPEWDDITLWFKSHEDMIRIDCGDFFRFGPLNTTVYHLNHQLSAEMALKLFEGDRRVLEETARMVAGFFIKLQVWIDRARSQNEPVTPSEFLVEEEGR